MFITEEDYIQIGADALKIMQQSTPDNRLLAEERAMSRIAGALRGRYDIEATFALEGSRLDAELVGCATDIALYHICCSLPQKMGYEIREKRYEQALKYLKEVQAGNITPDIPTVTGPGGEEDYHNPVRYGSAEKNNYIW